VSKLVISFLMITLLLGCNQIEPIRRPSTPPPTPAPARAPDPVPDPAPRSDPAPIAPPSDAPKRDLPQKDWKDDLAVPPGTSLEEGPEQVIRFLTKKDFREFGGKFWIAGKGFAMVNGAENVYFWGSANPPQLEVEVSDGSKEVLDACKKVVHGDFKGGKMLFLEGEGFFEEVETPKGSRGLFKVVTLSTCRLGSPKEFNKNPR
jgi:hypothetical protein